MQNRKESKKNVYLFSSNSKRYFMIFSIFDSWEINVGAKCYFLVIFNKLNDSKCDKKCKSFIDMSHFMIKFLIIQRNQIWDGIVFYINLKKSSSKKIMDFIIFLPKILTNFWTIFLIVIDWESNT